MEGKQKIRVLRIIARMNIGGPAIQVTNLMLHLPKSEIEQLLLTGECEAGEQDYLEFNRIHLEQIRFSGLSRSIKLHRDLKSFFFIRNAIKDWRPDIVHTHTFKAGLLGRLAVLTFKKRPSLVHTFHGHLLHSYVRGIRLRALRLIERLLSLRTDVLISVGNQVKKELLQAGIGTEEKFRIVPPGFAFQSPPKSATKSSIDQEKVFTCAWVGRFVEVKAPQRVVEVARALKEQGSAAKFLLAGDGPLRSEVQEICEKESLPIEFLGWISDVPSLLNRVHLLVLTSLNEGTPISIIEAQIMGVPVIATKVGSVDEVLLSGQTGYVVDYDSKRFADFILRLELDSSLYGKFSENAIRFSKDKFSAERLVSDHLEIYRGLNLSKPILRP